MKRWFVLGPALLATAAVCGAGCSEQIPQGHVGKVLTASGWNNGVAEPGHVACWGRDELYLLAAGDHSHAERLNVLCADNLNLRCELVIVARPKSDEASRDAIFLRVEARRTHGARALISSAQLYDVYVKPIVVPAAYEVLSKRAADQVGEELAEIKREIVQLCRQRMGDDAPMELALIDFTDTDYPESVTQSNEMRKQREIEIEIARSEAAIEEAKAEGRLRAANKEYQARLLDAKVIADSNRLINNGDSVAPVVTP